MNHGQYLHPNLHPGGVCRSRPPKFDPSRPERGIQKYITGIITRQGHKLLAINCMPDHTHILIGLKPGMALSDLVREIKTGSTNFINENRWVTGRFAWQEGFGAFSYSHSQLTDVIQYIRNQDNTMPGRASAMNTWSSLKNSA
jgi:REP element-mobilizing transposase RayT